MRMDGLAAELKVQNIKVRLLLDLSGFMHTRRSYGFGQTFFADIKEPDYVSVNQLMRRLFYPAYMLIWLTLAFRLLSRLEIQRHVNLRALRSLLHHLLTHACFQAYIRFKSTEDAEAAVKWCSEHENRLAGKVVKLHLLDGTLA